MYLNLLISLIIITGVFFSVKMKKLTPFASLCGGLLGFSIYFGVGLTGFVLLTVLFVLGTFATFWGYTDKQSRGVQEQNNGMRKAGQVLANAGFAGLLALFALFFPEQRHLLLLLMSAAFSSAAADTVSSEMGNLYGRNFYNVLTLKRDLRGLDGVVSLEGTLFGVAASVIIAMIVSIAGADTINFILIVLAGTVGNLFDSVLGASLERKKVVGNNLVNFLNTVVAVAVMYALLLLK
jgi:uncharacterized protein (TIGR00297 family)